MHVLLFYFGSHLFTTTNDIKWHGNESALLSPASLSKPTSRKSQQPHSVWSLYGGKGKGLPLFNPRAAVTWAQAAPSGRWRAPGVFPTFSSSLHLWCKCLIRWELPPNRLPARGRLSRQTLHVTYMEESHFGSFFGTSISHVIYYVLLYHNTFALKFHVIHDSLPLH